MTTPYKGEAVRRGTFPAPLWLFTVILQNYTLRGDVLPEATKKHHIPKATGNSFMALWRISTKALIHQSGKGKPGAIPREI